MLWPLASPANPAGWLMATARRRAIDAIRRRTALQDRYALLATDPAVDEEIDPDRIDDDVLALMFVSCHPVLSPEARVALTLRVVGGLSSEEVARAPQSVTLREVFVATTRRNRSGCSASRRKPSRPPQS